MTTFSAPVTKDRIESIDVLRGLVMLIMAIDHVRDFFHAAHTEPTNLAITTPFLFFTRWITHFCAPAFVFLSGISAYLAGTRRTGKQLSVFLIGRGIWLIVIELTLITFAGTLNPFFHLFVLQVIWAIGGSMILLGLLVRLRVSLSGIAVIGAVIFAGHNLFDIEKIRIINDTNPGKLLFSSRGFSAFWAIMPNRGVIMAYSLLPWAAVMFLGYTFGRVYNKAFDAAKRRRILLYSGFSLELFFFFFRYFNIYGDPAPWSVQKTAGLSVISFFNVTKYPCSLLYLCMTLGAALVILALTENIRNKVTSALILYGKVPFLFYVLHWYLLRMINVILFFVQGFTSGQIAGPDQQILFQPHGFGFNLLGVYIVWLVVISTLYFPCRWYGKYKSTHHQWWLSYL
jgi:uncharacterized membrane protein